MADKKKKGSVNTSTRYVKQHLSGDVTHTKKGASDLARACRDGRMTSLTKAILGFDGNNVMLECGHEYETGFLPPDNLNTCTRSRGHSQPHGNGRGFYRAE